MTELDQLFDVTRFRTKKKRLGRGPGTGLGKTCGRGQKGMGSRKSARRRLGYEGGQFRTFMKLPIRGFSNAPFRTEYTVVNLKQIEECFEDGELVDSESLFDFGLIGKRSCLIKVLGEGNLTKKVQFQVHAFSHQARIKLEQAGLL